METNSRKYFVYKKVEELTRDELMKKYNVNDSTLYACNHNVQPYNDFLFIYKNRNLSLKTKYVYQLYKDGEMVDEGTEKYLCDKYHWQYNYLCNCYRTHKTATGYTIGRRLLTNEDLENGNVDKWTN